MVGIAMANCPDPRGAITKLTAALPGEMVYLKTHSLAERARTRKYSLSVST